MFRFLQELWESFKEYIVLLTIILVSLGLLSQNDSSSIKHFRTFLFGTFAAVSSVTSSVVSPAGLRSEIEYLRTRNAELMLEVSKLRKFSLTHKDLESLEKFQDTSTYKLLPVRIMMKSMLNAESNFTLNKGTNDGIRVGLPLITDAGLVGVVSFATGGYAVVHTLKTSELKLIVQEERTRYQGIMRWNGTQLLVSNLPKTADIRVGDRFVTSVSSSIMNTPCPVGRVKKVLNPEEGNMYIVELEPTANLERVEYAFIFMNYSTVKPFEIH
ncbi:MAG: rod shape-determining protein MreC [Ignavibacteria bacterium]|nr:rod shape-determining protein MreC [Ignavibacteria bacterium]